MGILDLFFKKEEKNEDIDIEESLKIKNIKSEDNSILCDYCKEEILEDDKFRKISDKIFHRKCFKKLKKQVKNNMLG